MPHRLTIAVTVLLLTLVVPLLADRYSVTVRRIDRNLYRTTQNTIIETRLCLELAYDEEAILNWEGKYGDNWILFVSTKQTCTVIALR